MSLQFEAASKAQAERKATQQGMEVLRVEEIAAGSTDVSTDQPTQRGFFLRTAIVALIVVTLWWIFRDKLMGYFHH